MKSIEQNRQILFLVQQIEISLEDFVVTILMLEKRLTIISMVEMEMIGFMVMRIEISKG
jgi:hypothetical protein